MFKHQYVDQEERQRILDKYKDKFLIEDQVLLDGNFLIFSDTKPSPPVVYVNIPKEEFETLKQESTLLKAQSSALSERADFVEDVIAEMATKVYT
ncbi:hypothetical protein [Paenibacillus sp. ALJ109b]|uniref:hypothetical protein n=1 Tax=Paenibacillus sp. ALJ109b TaxID=2709068 RepID=UPI0013D63331|nr:hypothetical protein [Paenibacillus sp. ALJ109b]NEU61335.1 hypothetical protein [Paenibacillus sp. ALJ109b]